MKKLSVCLIAAAAAGLTGCGPIYKTSYTYQPPKSNKARRCVVACQRNRLLCEQNAQENYQRCEDRASSAAEEAYHEYAVNQRRTHQPVDRSVSDFTQDWSCSSGNRCAAMYRQCYSTCGGTVITHRVCTAFCDKEKKNKKA
ncbi:MAG: hypothetical protein P1U63_03290 [Coxiellaceae bacterium]|nr:hypothetical protein [Coxiellaceae bacterium]